MVSNLPKSSSTEQKTPQKSFQVPLIKILTTGGTIEKSYDEKEGVFDNKESFLSHTLNAKLRLPHTQIVVESIMNKDSLHMDLQDRLHIFAALKAANELIIPSVVLHGTDTLVESSQVCVENFALQKITLQIPIIFTGSMRPIGFETSDALQNVTEALLAAKLLGPGLYVSFHNQIFLAPHLIKNRSLRTFEWN
ncbi:MAG: asparaginase domain-containing protein [Bacteriovoracaceae bacterium]|nr:asparaginase domain-containing protein [Bacteriovoracaceae bacterium]